MNALFFGSLLLYFIAMVLQFAAAVFKKEKLGQGAWLLFLAAFAAGLPLDVLHGTATVAFLLAIWKPWTRQIRRIVAKYGL